MLIHLPSSLKPLDKAINCGTSIKKNSRRKFTIIMTTVPNHVTQNFFCKTKWLTLRHDDLSLKGQSGATVLPGCQ